MIGLKIGLKIGLEEKGLGLMIDLIIRFVAT